MQNTNREDNGFPENHLPPLFSFGIVSYNNYQYIFEAVDSVLCQTYPNIELLISNDGSLDFNLEELKRYITDHKRENIVRIEIRNHEKNVGTVSNVESVRQMAKGEFIMYMAADDALYDCHVLQRYADEFIKQGKSALVVSSRTAMCGVDLRQVRDYFPDEEGRRVIREGTSEQLFARMCHVFTLPTTSTCYRMSLYDVVGPYDTEYYIIEDAPLFIKIARLGIKVYWIDDMIGARHRDGGVSHNENKKITAAYRRYRQDEILFYQKEILPYQNRLSAEDRQKMEQVWEGMSSSYKDTFVTTTRQRRWNKVKQCLTYLAKGLNPQKTNLSVKGSPERNFAVAGILCWFAFSVISLFSAGVGCQMLQWKILFQKLACWLTLGAVGIQGGRILIFYGFYAARFARKAAKKVVQMLKRKSS